MPKTRCLGIPGVKRCNVYIDSTQSRCFACKKATKDERNRQASAFGPCPQTGLCAYCQGLYGPATPADPFVWGHHPVRFIDGGRTAVPIHKRCNEQHMKNH